MCICRSAASTGLIAITPGTTVKLSAAGLCLFPHGADARGVVSSVGDGLAFVRFPHGAWLGWWRLDFIEPA